MGINFDGVNPESKAKLEKIVSDGKITAEEVKGLTEAEKDALSNGLGGVELPVKGEIKIGEAPEPKKEEKSFFGKVWDGVKEFAGTKTGKAVIGGVVTAGALALTAATAGLGTAALVGAAGVLLTLTSCSSSDMDQVMYVSIQQEATALLEAYKKGNKELTDALNNLQHSVDSILNLLIKSDNKLSEIIGLMATLGKSSEEIIKLLKDQGKDIRAIYAALGEMNIEQGKQTELLEKLVGNDNVKIEYLEQILNEVRNGNKLQQNEQDILDKILEKLDKLDANDQQGAELMNQILAQLTAFVKQEGDMDATTHALLQTIINNQESMSYNIKADITEILKKLDQMDENAKARFTAIIPLLGSIGDLGVEILNAVKNGNALTAQQLQTIINKLGNQSDKLDEIRELIIQNNEIAQQTQDAVKDMSSKMSEEHKAILEAIKNGTANVDQIQKILVEIRNNTSVLPDMNKKLCVIGTAIEQVLKEVQGMRAETKQGLLEILAKIPDGCHCQPTDISGIIDLLNKLLDAIQKNPEDDKNHEGILTDLNKYFD